MTDYWHVIMFRPHSLTSSHIINLLDFHLHCFPPKRCRFHLIYMRVNIESGDENSLSMIPTPSWQKSTSYTFIFFNGLVLCIFYKACVNPFELWIWLAFCYTKLVFRRFVRTRIYLLFLLKMPYCHCNYLWIITSY